MRILIVAVNYNSYMQLNRFLESIRASIRACKEDLHVEVVVVDNSSAKQNVEMQPNEIFDLNVESFENLGYFGGAQTIINKYRDKSKYDYIAISNVDLKLNEDFFEQLSKYELPKGTGWVAPSVFSLQENRDKKTLNRPTKRKFKALCLLFKYPILFKVYWNTFYKRHRSSGDVNVEGEVYSGHGAFFLLTREFFKHIHTLDFKPFLFCEENYIAELLLENSLKCIYVPKLKIWDEEHVSTGVIDYRKMCRYNYEAHKFIYDSFYR